MADDLPFDPTQIISDDPNITPLQNATTTATDLANAQQSPDVIQNPAVTAPDNSASGMVDFNQDWHSLGGTQGNPVGAGSLADGVITALNSGHSWDDVQQYVNAVQPLNGGEDQLVSGTVGDRLLQFKKPSLNRLMDPAPIGLQDLVQNMQQGF